MKLIFHNVISHYKYKNMYIYINSYMYILCFNMILFGYTIVIRCINPLLITVLIDLCPYVYLSR